VCFWLNQLFRLHLGDRDRRFLRCRCFLLLLPWLQSKGFPLFCCVSFVVLIIDLNPYKAAWRCIYFGHPQNEIFSSLNKLDRPFGAG